MALISFNNLGARGIITDLAPNELPLDAWSGGKNVRFTQLGVERTLGNQNVYGTPSTEPLAAFRTAIGENIAWAYFGDAKAYSTNGDTQYDITRAVGGDYTVSPARKWNGGNFNGLVIANNGYDVPQVWSPTAYSTQLIDLPNWPANFTARMLRPFGNFLVAMDLTVGGVHKATALRWSHPADPGTVPASWDITDETKDAGEWYLNETTGACIDLVSLRNDGIIYKFDAIHRMQYVGGVYIFSFSKVSSTIGMPAPRCAVEVLPGLHIFWSGDDVLKFDGQNFASVIDSRCKKQLQNISDSTYQATFMAYNPAKSEIWLCWAEDVGNPYRATKALIFNWITGAWGVKDLPSGFNFIVTGPVNPTTSTVGDEWGTDAGTWDSDTFAWGDSLQSRVTSRLLGGTQTNLTFEGIGYQVNGVDYESYVERTGFGIPFKQGQPPDISSWKFCREIWPRMWGDAGTEIEVTIGTQTEISDDVTWGTPQTFVIGRDTKVNCTASGRLFGIRFRSTSGAPWTLNGYDLEVQRSGGY